MSTILALIGPNGILYALSGRNGHRLCLQHPQGRETGRGVSRQAEGSPRIDARKLIYEKVDLLNRKVDKTEAKVESIDSGLEKVEEPVPTSTASENAA